MHIPDGYLSPPWVAATYAASLAYAAVAARRLSRLLTPEAVTTVTVFAAAVFAAQMLNWPLPGGTSLHFVGGALAGIVLGPWLGFLAIALVVTVQALVFNDGGITTLGANILNMAVIDVVVGYAVYRLALRLLGSSPRARMIAAFLAGWLGITAAGTAAGVEIGLSPSFPYAVEVTVPVMAAWHAALGVIEGAITALVAEKLRSTLAHGVPVAAAAALEERIGESGG